MVPVLWSGENPLGDGLFGLLGLLLGEEYMHTALELGERDSTDGNCGSTFTRF